MNIKVHYFAQIRQLAGVESETIIVREGATAFETLQAADHGDRFRHLLFDKSGGLRPAILIVINGEVAGPDQTVSDGDDVQVFSPMAGG